MPSRRYGKMRNRFRKRYGKKSSPYKGTGKYSRMKKRGKGARNRTVSLRCPAGPCMAWPKYFPDVYYCKLKFVDRNELSGTSPANAETTLEFIPNAPYQVDVSGNDY